MQAENINNTLFSSLSQKMLYSEGNKGFLFLLSLFSSVFFRTIRVEAVRRQKISPRWAVSWRLERKEEEWSWCVSSGYTLFGGTGDLSCKRALHTTASGQMAFWSLICCMTRSLSHNSETSKRCPQLDQSSNLSSFCQQILTRTHLSPGIVFLKATFYFSAG